MSAMKPVAVGITTALQSERARAIFKELRKGSKTMKQLSEALEIDYHRVRDVLYGMQAGKHGHRHLVSSARMAGSREIGWYPAALPPAMTLDGRIQAKSKSKKPRRAALIDPLLTPPEFIATDFTSFWIRRAA